MANDWIKRALVVVRVQNDQLFEKDRSHMRFQNAMDHPAITNLKGKLVGTACPVLTKAAGAVVGSVACGVVVVVVVVDVGNVNEAAPGGAV